MHVDVKELNWIEEVSREPRLFDGLAKRGIFWTFAAVNVATRLYPNAESAMSVQNYAARRNHKGRGGDVVVIVLRVKEVPGPSQAVQRQTNRFGLTRVHGLNECEALS
jgi:hypothetical protein